MGTFITGIFSTLGSCTALYLITVMGRKKILIMGHILMGLAHGAVAIFNMNDINYGVVVSLVFFKFVFENTCGPVAWLYVAETT